MHPVFEILGREIPAYGLMGVCGFAASMAYIVWRCRREQFSLDDAAYIYVYAILGALVGAKILYLVISMPQILADLSNPAYSLLQVLAAYIQGGMIFYGGLLGGLAGGVMAARYFRVPAEACYPILIPTIPLFAGFGRLGCLLVGCCYGRETTSPLHVVFTSSPYAPNGVPLVPTQLYEALFDLILFVVLVVLSNKRECASRLIDVYLAAYAVFRFILEFYRGDALRGIWLLSTSQWISVAIVIYVLWHTHRRALKELP